jgi:hypothetical protein
MPDHKDITGYQKNRDLAPVPESLNHRIAEFPGPGRASDFPGPDTGHKNLRNCRFHSHGTLCVTEMSDEHRCAPKGGYRVCDIFAGDIRSAAVYWFKEGIAVTDVCTRHKTEAPDKVLCNIGKDITKDVRCHNHIVGLWVLQDVETQSIDELFVIRHAGLFSL